MTPSDPTRPANREEAVEAALLHTFQLSDKDYRKMQTAFSEVAFIRALEQDGYTVAALPTTPDPLPHDCPDDPPTPETRRLYCRGCLSYFAALSTPPPTDIPATFPLDLDAFLAGIDSPNHSPESRRSWIGLFFCDMKRAAALSTPPPSLRSDK